MPTADEIIRLLGMRPLPVEGGFYAETYRSPLLVPASTVGRADGSRSAATAIYYLLTPDTFSELHRLRADEIYHFYLGDPVELLGLHPDGAGELVTLGQELAAGMRVQHRVPAGSWQGSRLRAGGSFALLGTTMAPGFDPSDYESGRRADLIAGYPAYADVIETLTRG